MFKTLLVPLDGTPESNAVLPFTVVVQSTSGPELASQLDTAGLKRRSVGDRPGADDIDPDERLVLCV
jgi:hypothetical protein